MVNNSAERLPSGASQKEIEKWLGYVENKTDYVYTRGVDDNIWAIKNNGMDGDFWGANNIRTGGAGAIGHYMEIDDKCKSYIDKIKNYADKH